LTDALQLRVHIGDDLAQGRKLVTQEPLEHDRLTDPVPHPLARRNLPDHHAHGEHVGAAV
jgi:hypothetical protein